MTREQEKDLRMRCENCGREFERGATDHDGACPECSAYLDDLMSQQMHEEEWRQYEREEREAGRL
jgi:protein-arginine kinase activator protein McsA